MHPDVSAFPSKYFYGGKLRDGVVAPSSLGLPPLVAPSSIAAPYDRALLSSSSSEGGGANAGAFFGPMLFYDVREGREARASASAGASMCNPAEANFVATLVSAYIQRRLAARQSGCGSQSASRSAAVGNGSEGVAGGKDVPTETGVAVGVGVITPYKRQVYELRRALRTALGSTAESVEVNTVDGFQGREKTVIVFSAVRAPSQGWAGGGGGIGFVGDERRMNVALTRAKEALWVVGHARTLGRHVAWGALLEHAQSREQVVSNGSLTALLTAL
jgi:hypothetical protein